MINWDYYREWEIELGEAVCSLQKAIDNHRPSSILLTRMDAVRQLTIIQPPPNWPAWILALNKAFSDGDTKTGFALINEVIETTD